MITTAEITAMATEAQVYMDKSVVIQRLTRTPDGAGHTSTSPSTIASTVCSMGSPSGSYMAAQVALLGDLAAWVIQLPNGTDVQRDDLLVIGSNTLTVQHVYEPSSYSFTTQVLASEVR